MTALAQKARELLVRMPVKTHATKLPIYLLEMKCFWASQVCSAQWRPTDAAELGIPPAATSPAAGKARPRPFPRHRGRVRRITFYQ